MTTGDPREQANLLRWDRRRGWYEVYFLKFNHAQSRTAAWIRYTLTSPLEGDSYCELWGIFFDADDPGNNFAVRERFPIDRFQHRQHPFRLQVADAVLDAGSCRGAIGAGARRLEWDLQFASDVPVLVHFPHPKMYELAFPKTKVVAPHVHARFHGRLSAGGRDVVIDGAPGEQEHLWGTKHALRWSWGHCNAFEEDPDAVWEGLDAQIRLGPLSSPHLKLFYLRYEGRDHLFNRPLKLLTNRSSWELGRWEFESANADLRVLGEIRCLPNRFVGVTYTDPDGEKLWCNNTKVANVRLRLFSAGGNPMGELNARDACALEHVERKTHIMVPIRI